MMLRIREAFLHAEMKGKKIEKRQLAAKIWPNSTQKSSEQLLQRLMNGKAETIRIDFVQIICNELGCDANFLFDIKPVITK